MDSIPGAGAELRHRGAFARTLHRRAIVQGSITVPAAPAMLEEYVSMCLDTFRAIGVEFTDEQCAELRSALEGQLTEAFTASPRSEIVIAYDSPVGHLVNYRVSAQWTSVEGTYDNWVATREPPYFGTEPDARVWALASEAGDPRACPVLDIGAGTGRNSLALARRGHPVDALEVSGRFAEALQEKAREESLGIRVIRRDLFTAAEFLPRDYLLIVVSEVTSDFRSADELRAMFELASQALAPGGRLVVNAFIAEGGYQPDDEARQLGQQTYTAVFTRQELGAAVAGLPLALVDDISVLEYERTHQPAEAWPPTHWYEAWAGGRDLFSGTTDDPPIDFRWLVYRKDATA